MELERVGSKALAIAKADQKNIVPPKTQKKVLDEDAYTEVLIIVNKIYGQWRVCSYHIYLLN